ncbi:MAG: hypothetical protein AAF763_09335 [Pseudomonadota bacterium]
MSFDGELDPSCEIEEHRFGNGARAVADRNAATPAPDAVFDPASTV